MAQPAATVQASEGAPGLVVFDSESGSAYWAYALVPAGIDAEKAAEAVSQRLEAARERVRNAPAGQEEEHDWDGDDLARWCTEAGLVLVRDVTRGPQWD